MNIKEVLETMQNIQKNLLIFIEEENNTEENFQNLQAILDEKIIRDNKYFLVSIFHLITKIANNHYRIPNFFSKLTKIILLFKDNIKQEFSNSQIFNIFKSNKRIILILLEEKIMIMDEYIAKKILTSEYSNEKYPQYFYPELKPIIYQMNHPENSENEEEDDDDEEKKIDEAKINKDKNEEEEEEDNEDDSENDNDHDVEEELNEIYIENYNKYYFKEVEISEDFDEKRRVGENDDYICELIRKDLIEDFIIFVKKNNYPLNSTIKESIFETNQVLLKKTKQSLIEYAAFFGSIQIFNYLRKNGAKMSPSLWTYSVHGQCPEIFSILDEMKVKVESYEDCFKESIKCHHNEYANYFQSNYLNYEEIENSFNIFIEALKYHNFCYINSFFICQSSFYYLCKLDYPLFVELLLKNSFIDINHVII